MTRSIFCLLRIFQLQSSNGDIERLRESINDTKLERTYFTRPYFDFWR